MSKDYKEPLWKKIVDLTGTAIMLNLLFLVSCIPVVTIGPACSGLYTSIRYMIRGDKWNDGYKDGFCSHFLRKMLVGIVFTAAGVAMLFNAISMVMYQKEGFIGPFIGSAMVTVITLMISAGLVITSVYIPTGTTQWLRNGVNMVFAAPLQTLLGALFMWSVVIMFLVLPEILWIFLLVFITVYFPTGALITTMLWKNSLIKLKKANEEFLEKDYRDFLKEEEEEEKDDEQ